jgi:hypothetical protein
MADSQSSKVKTADKLSSEVAFTDPTDKKSATEADVVSAWQGYVGNADTLKVESFENTEGTTTYRLYNDVDNSTVAEAHGEGALLRLYKGAGLARVEDGIAPAAKESAQPHPMPASNVTAPADQVVISNEDSEENPGTAVAKARQEAGLEPQGDKS